MFANNAIVFPPIPIDYTVELYALDIENIAYKMEVIEGVVF